MPSSLGPAEILVILVVALIVLGPKRLPEAGRQVGKALSEVRRWSADVKREVRDAVEVDPPGFPPPAPEPPPGAAAGEASPSARPVDSTVQPAPAPVDPSALPGAPPSTP
jgi:Tat protein translocase TatB subunit